MDNVPAAADQNYYYAPEFNGSQNYQYYSDPNNYYQSNAEYSLTTQYASTQSSQLPYDPSSTNYNHSQNYAYTTYSETAPSYDYSSHTSHDAQNYYNYPSSEYSQQTASASVSSGYYSERHSPYKSETKLEYSYYAPGQDGWSTYVNSSQTYKSYNHSAVPESGYTVNSYQSLGGADENKCHRSSSHENIRNNSQTPAVKTDREDYYADGRERTRLKRPRSKSLERKVLKRIAHRDSQEEKQGWKIRKRRSRSTDRSSSRNRRRTRSRSPSRIKRSPSKSLHSSHGNRISTLKPQEPYLHVSNFRNSSLPSKKKPTEREILLEKYR